MLLEIVMSLICADTAVVPKFYDRTPRPIFHALVTPKFKERKHAVVVPPRVILWSDTANEKASWCGPCRDLKPTVKRMVEDGWPIEMHYLDVERETFDGWKLLTVPALQVIDPSGKEIARMTPGNEQGIVDFLAQHGIAK